MQIRFENIHMALPWIIEQVAKIKHTPVVSIAGGSSLGKSSIVSPLLQKELGDKALIIHQDAFRICYASPEDYKIEFGADNPATYFCELSKKRLHTLHQGDSCMIPRWSEVKNKGFYCWQEQTQNPKLIIWEGIYSFYTNEGNSSYNLNLYLEAPAWTRLLRRIVRNVSERKISTPANVLNGYCQNVHPAHHRFVRKQIEKAHGIIHSPYSFEQSIARFKLRPDNSLPEHLNYEEIHFDNNTSILIEKSERPELFWSLRHVNQYYYTCQIKKELAIRLQAIEWMSL